MMSFQDESKWRAFRNGHNCHVAVQNAIIFNLLSQHGIHDTYYYITKKVGITLPCKFPIFMSL
jgi:hypothetical protein